MIEPQTAYVAGAFYQLGSGGLWYRLHLVSQAQGTRRSHGNRRDRSSIDEDQTAIGGEDCASGAQPSRAAVPTRGKLGRGRV